MNNPYTMLFIGRDKENGIYTQVGDFSDVSRGYRFDEYLNRTGHKLDHDTYVFCNSKDPIQVQRKFNEVFKPWMSNPSYIDLMPTIKDYQLTEIAKKLKDSDSLELRLNTIRELDRAFPRQKKEGFVYLLESDTEYKIGVSTDVLRRAEQLGLKFIAMNYSLDSYLDEARLHILCSKWKSPKNNYCSEYFAKVPEVQVEYEKYFSR